MLGRSIAFLLIAGVAGCTSSQPRPVEAAPEDVLSEAYSAVFEPAYTFDPGAGEMIGYVLYEQGRKDEARTWFKRTLPDGVRQSEQVQYAECLVETVSVPVYVGTTGFSVAEASGDYRPQPEEAEACAQLLFE